MNDIFTRMLQATDTKVRFNNCPDSDAYDWPGSRNLKIKAGLLPRCDGRLENCGAQTHQEYIDGKCDRCTGDCK